MVIAAAEADDSVASVNGIGNGRLYTSPVRNLSRVIHAAVFKGHMKFAANKAEAALIEHAADGDFEKFLTKRGLRSRKRMAPRAGFEPATNRLTAGCSTTELPGNGAAAGECLGGV